MVNILFTFISLSPLLMMFARNFFLFVTIHCQQHGKYLLDQLSVDRGNCEFLFSV